MKINSNKRNLIIVIIIRNRIINKEQQKIFLNKINLKTNIITQKEILKVKVFRFNMYQRKK